tara:strand:+ start:3653 stop:4822 length:1170 start_codon:yes stop_codon:yes gene_type:complete
MGIYDDVIKKYIYGMPGTDTKKSTRGLIGSGGEYGSGTLQGLISSPAVTQGVGLLSLGLRGIDPATALQKTNQVAIQQEALKDRRRQRTFIDKYASEVPEADRELFKAYPELYIKSRGLGGKPNLVNMADPKTGKISTYNLNNATDLDKFKNAKSQGAYEVGKPTVQAQDVSGITGLSKSGKTTAEKKILGAEGLQLTLNIMDKQFEPAFLTVPGKTKAAVAEGLSKFGITTDEDITNFIIRKAEWEQANQQYFNQYRKEITGVAAGEKEIAFLQQSIPNVTDAPAVYKAKIKLQRELNNEIIERNKQFLQLGLERTRDAKGRPTGRYKEFLEKNKIKPTQDRVIEFVRALKNTGFSNEAIKNKLENTFGKGEFEKFLKPFEQKKQTGS